MKLWLRHLSDPTPEGWRYLKLRRSGPHINLEQRSLIQAQLKLLVREGLLEKERHAGPGFKGYGLEGYRPTGDWTWESWNEMISYASRLRDVRITFEKNP